MSSKLEPAIWPRDTGQRKPCFDSCQLAMTRMSYIKVARCKLADELGTQLGQVEYGRHVGLLWLLLGYY